MSLQRNVQQQNERTFQGMLMLARHYRKYGLAPGIEVFLRDQGIDLDTSAVVWDQTESYMLGFEHGLRALVVTQDRKFFTFELELNATDSEVVFVHEFSEVTSRQDISLHNKGTGKGYGALAIAVMETLNAA